MNFDITSKILDSLSPYIINADVTVSTDNKDWLNRPKKSDIVTIDAKSNVSFEVLENEIIVFYFTDHTHFEDYSAELEDGQDDYVTRAIDFLKELLCYYVCQLKFFKGKSLVSEKYLIMYHDGREDNQIGNTIYSFWGIINPFCKRRTETKTWIFDKAKGCFTNRDLKCAINARKNIVEKEQP